MKLLMFLVVSACIAGTVDAAGTPGLNYSYYEGDWTVLPNFFSLTPLKKGVSTNIDLTVRNKNASYAFLWQGNITIPVSGDYTFETNSDDGSKLYIGAYGNSVTPLIDNDGVHEGKSVSDTISLTAGDYPITIAYFQGDGGQAMDVYWSSNMGLARQKIPNSAFTYPAAALNYSYYEGSWNSIPDFSLLKAVKTGTKNNFDVSVRGRDTSYGITWSGFITIPKNGKYIFETSSDDGSKIYLYADKTTIVDNDGVHASRLATGSTTLTAGTYPIVVSYFQRDGDQDFKVYWSSNSGISRQVIPDIAFMYPPTVVNYAYYEGLWNTLPDFSRINPVKIGMGANINLNVRNRDTSYAIKWNSFLNITTAGDYTFETNSDDGSRLFLNNSPTPLIDNDGIHGSTSVKGTIKLEKGSYPITVTYFQKDGDNSMKVYWSSNTGIVRQLIPDKAFVSATSTASTSDPGTPVDTTIYAGLKGVHNYYFSTSIGDDMRTPTQAQDPATPWKTLSQLNDFFPNLLPGDAVLLKRGDIFDGFINVSASGTKGASIIFSAYSSGNKPIINGFVKATAWESVGGNIFATTLSDGVYVNCVTINNIIKPMGRYPNSEYLTVDSRTTVYAPSPEFTGPGTFTDAQLPASVNDWTGAEAVMRKNQYILDRCLITSHSGTTVSYISPSIHTPEVGFGYFIQNSIKTLDAEGEWYYDPIAKKLNIYTTADPYTLDVKGSSVTSLVVMSGKKSNLLFDNLQFQGADTSVFSVLSGCSDITIQNCDIDWSGTDVLYAVNCDYITFKNNTVYNTNSTPVHMIDCNHAIITDNVIKDIGLIPGLGLSTFAGYGGIYVRGSDNSIERNVIDSVGYNGIIVTGGNNIMVKNNYVSNFCLVIADGGGIYTNGDDNFIGREIIGNVITNGTGSFKGTLDTANRAASGIYLDELGAHIVVADNTVYNCVANGIYLHQAYDNELTGNTLVANGFAGISIVDDTPTTERIRNNTVTNNVLYAKTPSQYLLNHGSTANDLTLFGRYDSNYFCRPFDVGGYISTQFVIDQQNIYAFYDLADWSNVYPNKGIGGNEAPVIAAYTVTSIGTNKITSGNFNDNVNAVSTDANTNVTLDTKLDGTAAKFTNKGSATIADLVSVIDIGPTTPGITYRIKFSLIGNSNTANLTSYIRAYNNPDYPIVSDIKHFALRTSRTECEYLYVVKDYQPDVKLTFVVSGNLLPYWIDNVEVTPVEVTYTNIDDFIRFEYNPTNTVKSIILNGNYTDPLKNTYSNQVDIQPFSSILLTKIPEQNLPATTVESDSVKPLLTSVNGHKTGETELVTESISTLKNSRIYPNPVADILAARLYTEKTGNISLIIHDGSGRIVQTANYFKKDMVLEKTVNVSTLRAGLYYLEIKFNDGTSVTKSFIKN